MPVRATKRGDERTPLDGSHDVLICGASFAGLAVARELAGSGADVLIVDRYEIGERQTSACGIPTEWLRQLGLMEAERQRFDSLVMHTPHGDARYQLPWTFSTFDYRELCELLWRDCDARFETAKVNGRARAGQRRRRDRDRDRPRRRSPPRSSSTRSAGAACWPAATATSRPTRRSRAGSRSTPAATARTSRSGSTAATCPPATAGRFPAERRAADRDRLLRPALPRQGHDRAAGRGPRQASRTSTRATGSPTSCAAATEGGVFFAGDSAGHCLPLSAEGIRTALYFGIALGRELRGVVEGRQSREQAAAAYAEFNDSHEWKFRWMLRVQKLIPRIPPRLLGPVIRLMGTKRFVDWSFNHYLRIAPPEFAGRSAHDQDGPGQQQADAEQALGAERDLVEAEQA